MTLQHAGQELRVRREALLTECIFRFSKKLLYDFVCDLHVVFDCIRDSKNVLQF